jgi:hypothetical protein
MMESLLHFNVRLYFGSQPQAHPRQLAVPPLSPQRQSNPNRIVAVCDLCLWRKKNRQPSPLGRTLETLETPAG